MKRPICKGRWQALSEAAALRSKLIKHRHNPPIPWFGLRGRCVGLEHLGMISRVVPCGSALTTPRSVTLGDLHEVAACIIEHGCRHRAHRNRRLSESNTQFSEPVVLFVDIVDSK